MEPLHACPMRFLRPEKKNIMTCKHDESTMNIAEVKIVIETRHLLTEFSVPVLPATKFLLRAMILHYTYLPVTQEIYIFNFFLTVYICASIPRIDLYLYRQSRKVQYIGNKLHNSILYSDDQSFRNLLTAPEREYENYLIFLCVRL